MDLSFFKQIIHLIAWLLNMISSILWDKEYEIF